MVVDNLEAVLRLADTLPREQLPNFLGELEKARAIALMRLIAPDSERQTDQLLDVREAANRLSMSAAYLYRSHRKFPFVRRMGRSLRFSSAGIDRYLAQRRP